MQQRCFRPAHQSANASRMGSCPRRSRCWREPTVNGAQPANQLQKSAGAAVFQTLSETQTLHALLCCSTKPLKFPASNVCQVRFQASAAHAASLDVFLIYMSSFKQAHIFDGGTLPWGLSEAACRLAASAGPGHDGMLESSLGQLQPYITACLEDLSTAIQQRAITDINNWLVCCLPLTLKSHAGSQDDQSCYRHAMPLVNATCPCCCCHSHILLTP